MPRLLLVCQTEAMPSETAFRSKTMISIFDIFKIGIASPSSSHTAYPMNFAAAFAAGLDAQTARIAIDIYGSLALTGYGHGTFDALMLGLEGSLPHDIPLRRHSRTPRTHPHAAHPPAQRARNPLHPRPRPEHTRQSSAAQTPQRPAIYRLCFRRHGIEGTGLLFGRRRLCRYRRRLRVAVGNGKSRSLSLQQLCRAACPMPSEPARHLRSRVGKRSRACRMRRSRNPPPGCRCCRDYGRVHQTRLGCGRRTARRIERPPPRPAACRQTQSPARNRNRQHPALTDGVRHGGQRRKRRRMDASLPPRPTARQASFPPYCIISASSTPTPHRNVSKTSCSPQAQSASSTKPTPPFPARMSVVRAKSA